MKMVSSKMDKEKIAGWRASLDRTLHVFNVSTVIDFQRFPKLIPSSQTELTLSTNVIVGQTRDQVVEANSRLQNIEKVHINPSFSLTPLIVFRRYAPDLHCSMSLSIYYS